MEKAITRREAFKLGVGAAAAALGTAIAGAPCEAQAADQIGPNPGLGINRIWGENALDTMEDLYCSIPVEVGFEAAVICPNNDWHDALAASSLAGTIDGIILMTNTKKLSPQTKRVLDRYKPKLILVSGILHATGVMGQIQSYSKSWGANVFVTGSVDPIKTTYVMSEDQRILRPEVRHDTCIIARADDFADALAIAPYAYSMKYPILFSKQKPDRTLAEHIKNHDYRNAIIVGGEAALPKAVVSAIKPYCDTITRIAGKNAVETSFQIWDKLMRQDDSCFSGPGFFISTRNNYKDALVAAPICATWAEPLLLATPNNRSAIKQAIDLRGSELDGWIEFTIIGGPKAVPDTTTDWIFDYWNKKRK